MKSWIKHNWFKVSILVLVAAAIATVAFVVLKIKKEDDALALQKYADQQAQAIHQIQIASTTAYSNPFAKTSQPTEIPPQVQPVEDSTLKIARCQSDATIESELEISRYKGDVVQDIMNCMGTAGCNAQSLSSLLENVEDNNKQTSYQNVYNLCLQVSKNQFDSIEQTYDGYWSRCINENPPAAAATSSELDGSSGPSGMVAYNIQKDCESNLESTNGL